MPKLELSDDEIEILWRAGDDLSFAWFKFGDPYAVEKYREATTEIASESREILMLSDLFGAVDAGNFIAVGFQILPNPSGKPVVIPKHFFARRPERSEIHSDKLMASGIAFDRVRIIPIEELEITSDRERETTINVSSSKSPKSGRGNKSLYEKCAIVFEKLFADYPNLRLEVAEKIYKRFSDLYRQEFAPNDEAIKVPDVKTVRTHLKTYRQ